MPLANLQTRFESHVYQTLRAKHKRVEVEPSFVKTWIMSHCTADDRFGDVRTISYHRLDVSDIDLHGSEVTLSRHSLKFALIVGLIIDDPF